MSRWIDQFLTESRGAVPDIPDTMPSVSGLSGPVPVHTGEKSTGNGPPQYPQNAQNGRAGGNIEDIEDIEERESTLNPVVSPNPALIPPLQPGWFVAYRDRQGALCGGCVDRQHGTVEECRRDERGWTVHLTDGQRLPLSLIRSVGQTDSAGKLVAGWTVREHGYDGDGGRGHE